MEGAGTTSPAEIQSELEAAGDCDSLFESSVTINDKWQNSDLRGTKQIIYHSNGLDKSCSKTYLLLNLSHCVKSYGHLCQILAFFTMPTH